MQQHAAILAAQQGQQPPAPVQRQTSAQTGPSASPLTPEALARQRLLAAHTLYLANSTQDAHFPASPDDAYNLVLANLKNWGRYQVVDSVAHADLVLQLRDAVHANVVDSTDNTGSSVYYLSSFQLTLADPGTLSPLWTVNASIPASIKSRKQDALLAGDTLTAQDQSALKQTQTYQRNHTALAIGLVAAAAAVGLALFFVFKHHAEQDQAAFCRQHGISPCPGS
jgi:hypothetical protein